MAPWELEKLPLSPRVCVSLHEHILLPVFTRVCVCTARRGDKSFERYNLLSKTALFVSGILSTCPLHLSPATLTLNFVLYFSLYHPLLPIFFPLPLSRFTPTRLHALCLPFDKRPIPGTERSDICPPDPLPVNHAATFRAGEHTAVFEAASVPDCSSISLSKQN